jgi:hypothetical protein
MDHEPDAGNQDPENDNPRKTKCPFCQVHVWKWHIKRHIRHHVTLIDNGAADSSVYENPNTYNIANTLSPVQPPSVIPPSQESSSSFSSHADPPFWHEDDTYSCYYEDNSGSDSEEVDEEMPDEADMFADEIDMTVEDYINNLTDKYDPKRVLKYLSWSPRPITTTEQESIRLLRCLSFGAGTSRAHSQEAMARLCPQFRKSIQTLTISITHPLNPFPKILIMYICNVHNACT